MHAILQGFGAICKFSDAICLSIKTLEIMENLRNFENRIPTGTRKSFYDWGTKRI